MPVQSLGLCRWGCSGSSEPTCYLAHQHKGQMAKLFANTNSVNTLDNLAPPGGDVNISYVFTLKSKTLKFGITLKNILFLRNHREM